jgi:hypothetical protein
MPDSPPVIQGLRYTAGGLRAQANHLDGAADQIRIEAARIRHLADDLDARADILDQVSDQAQSEHASS